MLTVQNGKGSRCRIGDMETYRRNFAEIDFRREVTCPACRRTFLAEVPFPKCPTCGRRKCAAMPGARPATSAMPTTTTTGAPAGAVAINCPTGER